MSGACPVVRIKTDANDEGFVEINVSDFDPAIHERLDGDDEPLPGPFDEMQRGALLELAHAEVKAGVDAMSDEDLRGFLTYTREQRRRDAQRAAEEAAEVLAAQRGVDDFLLGSSVLDAIVIIGDLRAQLGGLVVASQVESGLSSNAWNDLSEADREARLAATIERLTASPDAARAEIDPASMLPPAEPELTPEQIAALDRDHDGAAGGSTAATDEEKAVKTALVDAIVALGGEKPHHATGLPRLAEIKAELEVRAAALDAPQETAGGLTLRELHADLVALGVEWAETETPAELLAKRDAARAERAEKPAGE